MKSSESRNDVPIPVTIVTGFLGSGKTTLINFVLSEVGGTEKLAIIKNEIGDVAVDSEIIRGKNIVMKELLNGCVCCTLIGDLEESLEELVETVKPDRIIIEASGAANPAILAVNLDRMDFVKRDLIVTVVDALNFGGYKDKTIVGHLQHKFTDLIVLNRVGDVDENTIDDVLDDIYELRPGISVVRTETGRVNPDVLFGVRTGGIAKEGGKSDSIELSNISASELHEHHLHEDEIQTFSLKNNEPLDRERLEVELGSLSDEYYRVKGFVWFGDDAIYLLNFVCGRYEMEEMVDMAEGSSDSTKTKNRIVFIGKGIKKYEKNVLARLTSKA